MDLSYPLTYLQGSIALVDTAVLSQARHLLDTIAGERILSPAFGVPLDILYNTGLPQILAERIRIAINQITGVAASAEVVSYQSGILTLKVTLATGEILTAQVNN